MEKVFGEIFVFSRHVYFLFFIVRLLFTREGVCVCVKDK